MSKVHSSIFVQNTIEILILNFSNPKNQQSTRLNGFNGYWKQKTKLEQKLLIILIITIILLIGLIIFIIIIHAGTVKISNGNFSKMRTLTMVLR